ncbi:MAG: hypothetical protein GAK37_01558 [Pseudomonas sp.]|nr:MAG: hypothetical protein GAK37_01558 [Pseudomonas sp.]
MPAAKIYSLFEVDDILMASEGRLSPVSMQPGHAMNLHVNARGEQISDRLMRTGASSSYGRGFIVGANGEIANENQTKQSWASFDNLGSVSTGVAVTAAQRNATYRQNMGSSVATSGAFADRQDAIQVARMLLNSGVGQTELAKLDSGAEQRVVINLPVAALPNGSPATMYLARRAAALPGGDITGLTTVTSATMIVDRQASGDIHVQTFFPVA